MLQDDPSFIAEIALPILSLDAFLKDTGTITTAFETQSSVGTRRSASHSDSQHAGLIIPSDSFAADDDLIHDFSGGSIHDVLGEHILSQPDVQLEDAQFEFDEEGNILELPLPSSDSRTPQVSRPPALSSDAAGTGVRRGRVTERDNFKVSESQLELCFYPHIK
jgi:hypothetical protein